MLVSGSTLLRTITRTAVAAVILLGGGVAEAQRAQPAPAAAGSANPDAVRVDAARKGRALKAEGQQKVLAALQADPRYAGLQKELADASKIVDINQQISKLRDISTRAQAVRSAAIRKAGVDVLAIDARASEARKVPAVSSNPIKPRHPGTSTPAPAAPTVVTAFTEIDTRKIDCPDGGDTWSFSGSKSHFDASSSPLPGDHDCGWIRASKGASLTVPPGTRHVEMTIKLDFDLKVVAAGVGIYASADAEVGVRVENMNGTPIDVLKLPGVPPIPSAVSFCWTGKPVNARQDGPDVLPLRESGNQGLNEKITCSFDVDPRGGVMMITPYVGGSVDADLTGFARSLGTVNPRSVEATFTK